MDGIENLRRELNGLYQTYHRAERLAQDPLGLVSGRLSPENFEWVSYVSASLSYGRVEQIRKSLENLWLRLELVGLGPGGEGLHQYFVDNSGKSLRKEFSRALKGWVHRFNDEEDIRVLFQVLQVVAQETGSLGVLYAASKKGDSPTERLENFVQLLRSRASSREKELFRWFACAPSDGSTCKRLVMWLSWMLRSDEIDPGLWSKNPALSEQGIGSQLAFIPLDTHVHQWAQARGLLTTKNPSWKAVEELTEILRLVDPQDPARFDFCICHSGMARFRAGTKDQRAL